MFDDEHLRVRPQQRGWVSEAEIERLKAAGFTDGDVAEVVANVALHTFTNYFNHVNETVVDFPRAPVLAAK